MSFCGQPFNTMNNLRDTANFEESDPMNQVHDRTTIVAKIDKALLKLKWCTHYFGWTVTGLSCLTQMTEFFGWRIDEAKWFIRFRGRQLDKRFNISTIGIMSSEDSGIAEHLRDHATYYEATQTLDFPLLMSRLEIVPHDYTFVDYGSGMGRVILSAAEFPFRSVVGVELSEQLHLQANRNIQTFRSRWQRCTDVQSMWGDAAEFDIPDTPLVLYFYNPFDAVVISQVLDRIAASFRTRPRRIVILYLNPVHERVMNECRWLRRVTDLGFNESEWRIYESDPAHVPAGLPNASPTSALTTVTA